MIRGIHFFLICRIVGFDKMINHYFHIFIEIPGRGSGTGLLMNPDLNRGWAINRAGLRMVDKAWPELLT